MTLDDIKTIVTEEAEAEIAGLRDLAEERKGEVATALLDIARALELRQQSAAYDAFLRLQMLTSETALDATQAAQRAALVAIRVAVRVLASV